MTWVSPAFWTMIDLWRSSPWTRLGFSNISIHSVRSVWPYPPSVFGSGMLIPDPDFYPSRIPYPKTAAKERGEKKFHPRMRSSLVVRASDCQCSVATFLGSIPASVGTVESEGRQMKQCWILYEQKEKNHPQKIYIYKNLLSYLFCSHKFHIIENYFIFEMLKKKIWSNFQRIIELFTQKIVTELSIIWVWDPGSGKNLFRIPDPGVKKAPDPGSGSEKLSAIIIIIIIYQCCGYVIFWYGSRCGSDPQIRTSD